jgi:hypothetical protein
MVSQSADQRLSFPPAPKRSRRVFASRLALTCCLFTAACGSAATTVTTTETLTNSGGSIVTTTRTSTQKTLLDVILAAGSSHLEVKTDPGATCAARAFDGAGHDISGPDLTRKKADAQGSIVWNGNLTKPVSPSTDTSSGSSETTSNSFGTFKVSCSLQGTLPAPPATETFVPEVG